MMKRTESAAPHGARVFFAGKRDKIENRLLLLLGEENTAIFESLRTYQGVLFKTTEHLRRLYESARSLRIPVPEERAELRSLLEKAARGLEKENLFFRLNITAAGAFVLVSRKVYAEEVFEKGVNITTSVLRKSPTHAFPPQAKTSAYGGAVLAYLDKPAAAFEVLFLSQEGLVREAANSNIFMIKNDECVTPPAQGILPGITRDLILDLCRQEGIAAREAEFTRHELFNAEEIFLSNTSGEIIPVRAVDSRVIGTKTPGKWTLYLRRKFRENTLSFLKRVSKHK